LRASLFIELHNLLFSAISRFTDSTFLKSSYEHHSIDEPAILLGGAFVVDILEKEIQP
jgi:hypothetical protein